MATGDRGECGLRRRLSDPEDGIRTGTAGKTRGAGATAMTQSVRYHGELTPASPDRSQIVPGASATTVATMD